MGCALRHITLAPSRIRGGRVSPAGSRLAQGWLWLQMPELTPLIGKISPATLLKTCLSIYPRAAWCLLCLPKRFNMETPALTRAGGSGIARRVHPRWGPRFGPYLVLGSLHPPNLSATLPSVACPARGLSLPLHPSLLRVVPPFIKTILKFSCGLSTSAACTYPTVQYCL